MVQALVGLDGFVFGQDPQAVVPLPLIFMKLTPPIHRNWASIRVPEETALGVEPFGKWTGKGNGEGR
jgi:hypothetical protein